MSPVVIGVIYSRLNINVAEIFHFIYIDQFNLFTNLSIEFNLNGKRQKLIIQIKTKAKKKYIYI